jgi:hypothetical protein
VNELPLILSVLNPKGGFWGELLTKGFAPGTASDLDAQQSA